MIVDYITVEERSTVLVDWQKTAVGEFGQNRGVNRVRMHGATRVWTVPVHAASTRWHRARFALKGCRDHWRQQ